MSTERPRLGVLLSGGGRSLENLAACIARGELDAEIACVLSNTREAYGLERAKRLQLGAQALRPRDFASREAWGAAVYDALRSARVDYVCLLGFLALLPIAPDFEGRVLNIHPALLPDFGGKGMYGTHVHRAVLASGARESGCTVHLCDEEYDRGEILVQRRCRVLASDDAESLAARVFEEEKRAFPAALRRVFERDGFAPSAQDAWRVDEVLFDLDGTLIDSIDLIVKSYEHALEAHGKPRSSYASILAHVGVPLAEHMRTYAEDAAEIAAMSKTYRAWNDANHDRLVRAHAGVDEMLAALRARGKRVGVVTSKMHAAAWRGLEHCGLAQHVDFVLGADDVDEHKPSGAPVLAGCARLERAPEACAYVGDSVYDMQAAASAGCLALGAKWGPFDPAKVRAAGADALLDAPLEVLDWLRPANASSTASP